MDWMSLRSAKDATPRAWNSSMHKHMLREHPPYRADVGWRGEPPQDKTIISAWKWLVN